MSGKLDVALYFDVEDYFHPPEMGSDDIIRTLALALDAEDLRANFLFIAVRAKLLRERGRQDVIDSLARHEVGVHTLTGEHPCLPEYTAGKDWDSAVAATRDYEGKAWQIVRDVFGRDPVCLSQHAQYGAPYIFPVCREFGVPHAYGYVAAPPQFGLSWYAGALNIPYVNPQHFGPDVLPYFEVGDENYDNEMGFQGALARLDRRISACLSAGQPYLTIFICHPYHLRCVEFTDFWQYNNGVNIPVEQWGIKNGGPHRRTDTQMEIILRNLARLFRYIHRHEALNVLTLPEIQRKYGTQPASISKGDLLAAAQLATATPYAGMVTPGWYRRGGGSSPEVVGYGDFSPGELTVAWAQALRASSLSNSLPAQMPRVEILGPRQSPFIVPEVWHVSRDTFQKLVADFCAFVETHPHLPHNLGEVGERVGLGTLYRAFAEMYLTLANEGVLPESITLPRYPRLPAIAQSIGYAYLDISDNDIVAPDLPLYNIITDAKLQSWTLKPARAEPVTTDPLIQG